MHVRTILQRINMTLKKIEIVSSEDNFFNTKDVDEFT